MVIDLKNFKKSESGEHLLWSNGKGSYVITDKKNRAIDHIYIGDGGVDRADVVRILIGEYEGDRTAVENLKKVIGERTTKRKALGEA